MRAEDNVVSVALDRQIENFIREEANERHEFHFDPRGFQRTGERVQARFKIGEAFTGFQRPSGGDPPLASAGQAGSRWLDNVQQHDPGRKLLGKLAGLLDDEFRCFAKIDSDKEVFLRHCVTRIV